MTRRHRRLLMALGAAAAAAVVYATVGGAALKATPQNTSPPTISGNAVVGDTLAANGGGWTGNPTSYGFQWERCDAAGGACANIAGATGQTYVVQNADNGKRLRVAVTATNADGTGGPAISDATSAVTAATGPKNTAPPVLSGTLQEGQTLTVTPGTWTGTAPLTYTYEWQRCNAQGVNCAPISGASGTTYKLVAADVGNRIQVRVTATNSAGATSTYSNQSGVVGSNVTPPANAGAPAITGSTTQGQTLTVTSGTWTGTGPIAVAIEWQRCDANGQNCTAIPGATGQTYVLTAADTGHKLQVSVTATNAGGGTQKYSNQVGPVVAATGGVISAANVALPDRLVVDRVQFPSGGHSRTPFAIRIHIADTQKHAVSGALVYVLGLPYSRIANAPEQPTDATGWATVTLRPTTKMPRNGYLVMFVRARTPGGDLLAGASTRRLVQVRITQP